MRRHAGKKIFGMLILAGICADVCASVVGGSKITSAYKIAVNMTWQTPLTLAEQGSDITVCE
jgi:hypothetical protein